MLLFHGEVAATENLFEGECVLAARGDILRNHDLVCRFTTP
jgi:hypothetical protein